MNGYSDPFAKKKPEGKQRKESMKKLFVLMVQPVSLSQDLQPRRARRAGAAKEKVKDDANMVDFGTAERLGRFCRGMSTRTSREAMTGVSTNGRRLKSRAGAEH